MLTRNILARIPLIVCRCNGGAARRAINDQAQDELDTFRYIEKQDKSLAEEFLLREISNVKAIMKAQNEINILKSVINLKETEIEEEKQRALDLLRQRKAS